MVLGARNAGFTKVYRAASQRGRGGAGRRNRAVRGRSLLSAIGGAVSGHGGKWRRRTQRARARRRRRTVHGDLADVRGQLGAKRALEIAAAGGHNSFARRAAGLRQNDARPPASLDSAADVAAEALDVTKIYSVAGLLGATPGSCARDRFAFRITRSSQAALVGGGAGQARRDLARASTACFFSTSCRSSRAARSKSCASRSKKGPSRSRARPERLPIPRVFMLVASMNPCPCGYRGTRNAECRCDDAAVAKYVSKLSGPLLDRIDLQIEIARVPFDDMVRLEGADVRRRFAGAFSLREIAALRSLRRNRDYGKCGDPAARHAYVLCAR